MKTKILFMAVLCLAANCLHAAPIGTAFTYQGYLSGAGAAANGNYDLQFALFDAASNGNAVGPALTNLDVAVNNGFFLVTLDFGNVFDGSARWMALGVRTNGNASAPFAALLPLQPLSPTPYAINAGAASTTAPDSITATQLSTTGSPAAGQVLAYNGTNLVWTTTGGGSSNAWSLTGNAGTSPSANFVGTTDNNALLFRVNGVRAWEMMPTIDAPNVIGGAPGNYVASAVQGATIGGGGTITTYGRAYSNSIFSFHGTIGGGLGNTIQANAIESTIAGGNQNFIQNGANDSAIGGGYLNAIEFAGGYSSVAGGNGNTINAPSSAIGGGNGNEIYASSGFSFIGGGQSNKIDANNLWSLIGGGAENYIGSDKCTIGGGAGNYISDVSGASFIGGGQTNEIDANSFNSIIGGGFENYIGSDTCAIGGGSGNIIGPNASESFIGGGYSNYAYGPKSAIGGGSANFIDSTSFSVIGGGYNNYISAAAPYSTIPGGQDNIANAAYCFAAGNQAQAQNRGCFVWADSQSLSFSSTANDQFCVRAQGGVQLDPTTSISFGSQTRQMLNLWGAAYGIGVQNDREYFRAGDTNAGFAWFMGGTHNDTADNPGSGGVEVMKLTYGIAEVGDTGFGYEAGLLHVIGQLNVDANAYASDFYSTSDRNKKELFGTVDAGAVLEKVSALPITTWNFKGHHERHLGPMAQDFRAVFALGPDDKHISTLDEGGVALAAIQGLNQKLEEHDKKLETALKEKDARIAQLEKEMAAIKSAQHQTAAQWEARFDALQKVVARVADKSEAPLAVSSTLVR
jgi:hypothetical protein